jgi:hypothetical protein
MSEAVLDYPTPLAAPRAEDLLTGLHRPGGVAAAVDSLADCDPGPGLCALLEALDGKVDRAQHEHLLAAWDRQVAWSMARLYGAASVFAGAEDSREWVNLETIRHALGLSRHGARNIALIAQRLVTVFPTTFGLLQRGRITRGHVWALVELTKGMEDEPAGKVEEMVVADAPGQTIASSARPSSARSSQLRRSPRSNATVARSPVAASPSGPSERAWAACSPSSRPRTSPPPGPRSTHGPTTSRHLTTRADDPPASPTPSSSR